MRHAPLASTVQRTSRSTPLPQPSHGFWPADLSARPSRCARRSAFIAFFAAFRSARACASPASETSSAEDSPPCCVRPPMSPLGGAARRRSWRSSSASLSLPSTAPPSAASGLPPARRCALQRLEQVVTSSQQRSHFLRQVKGRSHTMHTLLGRFSFLTPRIAAPLLPPPLERAATSAELLATGRERGGAGAPSALAQGDISCCRLARGMESAQ
mmetsp:Transcript_14378/g.36378  ORF Transcript_14378/g.36378 Transcript_14378/m.36378 type:complete len:214 (-) Transcript_14378:29-670(-)